MRLHKIKIKNFRNIDQYDFEPIGLINYFHSPNGTGKTNLLEAIQCLTVGKTLRSKSENDLLNFESPKSLHVTGEFEDEDSLTFAQTYYLELLQPENLRSFDNENTKLRKKKTLLVNKTKTSLNNYVGRVPSIWFSPESIKIITSSPRSKREYFDNILIQLLPQYMSNLRNFNRALKQRNRLLLEDGYKANLVRVWTEQLIEYGAKVMKSRVYFFNMLNVVFGELDEVTRYKFYVKYQPNIDVDSIFDEDTSFRYREELRKSYEIDKRKGSTSRGPHKDDWHMMLQISGKSTEFIRADKFASRGQQRMSLILLQLVLIKIFKNQMNKKPILLLDDIFSELDEENAHILLDVINEHDIQSFITGVGHTGFKNMHEINLMKEWKR